MKFSRNNKIILMEHDSDVTYSFSFPSCTSATANDGNIPYDSVISSVEIEAYKRDGVDYSSSDVSSSLISASSNGDNIVYLDFQYPDAAGFYKVVFKLTLDTGVVLTREFANIEVK